MKITYSHVEPGFRESIETECANRIEKLQRLLKRYAPESAVLHSTIEKTPRKTEYSFSLSLTLHTGSLYATGTGVDVPTSARAAFTEIESQLKKHLEKLRKDYVWKRKRPRSGLRPGETTAAD